jgi:hypothetical protein
MYHGALTGARTALVARATLALAFALCADWIASDTPISNPATIINRISINSSGLGLSKLVVGLAERGQRRVEEPRVGLDQVGLDTYVDPDLFRVSFDEM